MAILFKNNAHSTLASSISDSATSITLATGHGNARFPATSSPDYFYATLIDGSNNLEVVKCTNRSADVLTVVRAQESTTARAYSTGDRIELRITAQGLADLNSDFVVADESSDTTCFPIFVTAATGALEPKSGSNLTFNSSSGALTATSFVGDLTGNVTGNASGTAATVTGAAQTNITSLGTLTGLGLDGDKNITPGDGSMIHLDTSTLTDNNTSGSGTATKFTSVSFEAPTLAASNSSVTTTDAATVHISGPPTAGTNQTLTRAHALWVDSGNIRFDGSLYAGTTHAMNSSGLVQVANQSSITGVGTISSGTWQGTDVGVAHGGTGASTLTANGVLIGNGTSAVTAVDLSTKGKILIGDGSGNPQALAVGSNDQVLTADSSEATGVKWAAAGGGGGGLAVLAAVNNYNSSSPYASYEYTGFSSSYDNYYVLIHGIALAGDGDIEFQFMDDGSAITSAGYRMAMNGIDGNGTDRQLSANNEGDPRIFDDLKGGDATPVSGFIYFHNGRGGRWDSDSTDSEGAVKAQITLNLNGKDHSNYHRAVHGGGHYDDAAANSMNGFKLIFGGGGANKVCLTVYGVVRS